MTIVPNGLVSKGGHGGDSDHPVMFPRGGHGLSVAALIVADLNPPFFMLHLEGMT